MNHMKPGGPMHLVPEVPVPVPVHAAVAEAAIYMSTEEAEDGSRIHTARFGTVLDREAVLDILPDPLTELVPAFYDRDVRQGLRAQTYPNSRIVRNTRHLGRTARATMREMRPDLQGLVDVIDKADSHEMVSAKVHLYDEVLADIVAVSRINAMKPAAVKALCDTAGIEVDELTLLRQRNSHGGLRAIQLARAAVGAEELREAYVRTNYTSKKILAAATIDTVFIPNHEIPPGITASYPYIERVRRLRPRPDRPPGQKTEAEIQAENEAEDIATYWEALFRREGTPRHVAMPIVQWREAGLRFPSGSKRPVWESDTLLFNEATKYYDARRHCVVHVSPVLGTAMIAHSIDPTTFAVPLHELFDSRQMPRSRSEFPRKAAGVLPALLTSAAVSYPIISSEAFQRLR